MQEGSVGRSRSQEGEADLEGREGGGFEDAVSGQEGEVLRVPEVAHEEAERQQDRSGGGAAVVDGDEVGAQRRGFEGVEVLLETREEGLRDALSLDRVEQPRQHLEARLQLRFVPVDDAGYGRLRYPQPRSPKRSHLLLGALARDHAAAACPGLFMSALLQPRLWCQD